MPMDPETLYRQLRQLVADTPRDLVGTGAISAETHRWLGRATALLAETFDKSDFADLKDKISFTSAVDGLVSIIREQNAHQIVAILHRALARAERNAPAAAQGAFFAPLVPERITVRLLTDSFSTKPETLQPAAARWAQQHGATRPLEIRLTGPRQLHDRLIVVDRMQVWSLTQSLKDFANRSPGSALRVEGDVAAQKIHAYEQLWAGAKSL